MIHPHFFRSTAVVLAVAATIVLAGCQPQATDTEDTNSNTNVNTSVTPTPEPSLTVTPSPTATPTAEMKPTTYVEYENKAVGYRIQRPDKWYWQHLIRSQIGENAPLVDDYFISDRNPLPQLGSEYLGRIVIEVSRRDASDIAPSLEGFVKTDATVGGQPATRYEGVRNNELVKSQTWIEYQFTKFSRLFRFIFAQADSTPADIAVFEEVVKSFSFTQ